MKHTVVFLRHGESIWNKENRFTGWTDVDLGKEGLEEARRAGEMLRGEGYVFDIAYTSVLRRAIKTLWIVLEQMDLMWIPVRRNWRLNERHYGALQGLNKTEMAELYGEQQVHLWRRSYDVRPPALDRNDERYPGRDPRYGQLDAGELPRTESLKDTVVRVLPYWNDVVAPDVKSGNSVIIVAHGNSLRALLKKIDSISDDDIPDLEIPTGNPLVYEFDETMAPVRHFYLKSC